MKNFNRNRSRGWHGQKNNRSSGRGRHRNSGSSINPLRFVKRAAGIVEKPYVSVNNFSDLPLDAAVKRNVLARGFEKPTAVQDQAILPILDGKDLVGIANTGTGKTAAFLLPLITKVSKDRNQKVLIVTPTRELAAQIQDEFKLFSAGLGLLSTLCIGGASLKAQTRQLYQKPNFVIGTPGRLKDLERRRILKLNQYENVVLDEVDRMLDMGFIHDIKHIISLLPKNRQSLFFSATVPQGTKLIMQSFLTNPVTVSVVTGATPCNVDQDIIRIRGEDKLEILHQLLIKKEFRKVLIFGRTKWGVSRLEESLSKRGFKAAAIHGNKSQGQRLRALNMLKNNRVQILLATDVASRGLDIENVSHVINYDVPGSYNDYVHRIGRTGRAGKKGIALTFVD
ncbi:MAG: DEAD/DEAH box helicase [bacterium]